MKRLLNVLIIFLIFFGILKGSETIPGLNNPKNMIVHKNRIYIADFPKIKVFDAGSLGKISEFGKKGEGPGEFINYTYLEVAGNRLVIDSMGKHSYYTPDGVFIKEKKFKAGGRYKILGKNYASYGMTQDGKTAWQTVNILDRNLQKIKELYRFRYFYQEQGPSKGVHIIDYYKAAARTSDGKLVVSDIHDFRFSVYDEDGKLLTVIRSGYRRIPITHIDREKYYQFFKNDPGFKPYYESHKNQIQFPSHYPPVRDYLVIGKNLYVFTYLQNARGTELFIYDLNGKLESQKFVPVKFLSVVDMGPVWISDGQLYQLSENEDKAEWELKILEL